MAGYKNDYSESNNSFRAKEQNRMPASHIAKWMRQFKRFKGVTVNFVKKNLKSCEWHHTSCKYNATDFFSIDDVILNRKELSEKLILYKKENKKNKKKKVKYFKCWNKENSDIRKWEYRFTSRCGNNVHDIFLIKKEVEKILSEKVKDLKNLSHKTYIRICKEKIQRCESILEEIKEEQLRSSFKP